MEIQINDFLFGNRGFSAIMIETPNWAFIADRSEWFHWENGEHRRWSLRRRQNGAWADWTPARMFAAK
ncbi:MAG: hypothetical protein C0606_03910 [Hyphomicrobiales bacterium]|nr:MAG: hypothetical protein C0606_03910 [Hyphomicrobiales bacterium]